MSDTHLRADFFAHRNQRDTDHRHGLVQIALLLRVEMVCRFPQERLDLHDVARGGIREGLHERDRDLAERRFDRLEHLDRRLGLLRPTCTGRCLGA